MSKTVRLFFTLAFLIAIIPATPALAQDELPPPGICTDYLQENGAIYRICMPTAGWNGDLVVFAHGYVAPNQPVAIPEDQLWLPDGTYTPLLVNGMGYAFAMTSYPENGLAILSGMQDTRALLAFFGAEVGAPVHAYLVGASEGALIATRLVEQYPKEFTGGMALCGPIGNFQKQINHFGDFRVVFDYFFPGVLPFSPVEVPPEALAMWDPDDPEVPGYQDYILAAIAANPDATRQLLSVTRAPYDLNDPSSIGQTVVGLLWYNVFATTDAQQKLGGQPFGNKGRLYFGSDNDRLLNRNVQRFTASQTALEEIAKNYQTSGKLRIPLVSLHTTGDPIVPYWHAPLYRAKTIAARSATRYLHIPILRYGHCTFQASEILAGFSLLQYMATGQAPLTALNVLPDESQKDHFLKLVRDYQRNR